jgi:SAM-dependent methyltransferase
MEHADHVDLIRDGVTGGGTVWADLGSGAGAFTLALADLLGPGSTIHSVDRDARALRAQARSLAARFGDVAVHQIVADFTEPMALPDLDGVVMANSLHFVRDKLPVLRRVTSHLRDGGRFVLVEYDADRGNPWVPHPLSFGSWTKLAGEAGLRDTRRIGLVPSRFLGAIYSAVSVA